MSYFQYRSNESFEEFVIKSLKSISKDVFPKKFTVKDFKKLDVKLNPESQINSFTTENGYTINIKKVQSNYYEFILEKIPETFNLLFGCELETCMNLDCSGNTYNDFIKSELNFLRNAKYNEKMVKWQTMILFHLQINIIPHLTPTFLKRFKYAYIQGERGRFMYIDLSNGAHIENKKVDEYKTLQFVVDGSVRCGDHKQGLEDNSVHCEIVSPILNNLSELKLLYDNVISKTCNYSNSSAGFHVNISIVDQNKVPFKFTKPFEMELFKNWYNFEEAHYEEYRGNGTIFAQRLGNYVKDNEIINSVYVKKSDDSSLIEEEEVLSDYGLKNIIFMEKTKHTNDMYDGKYHSIYKKSESILECRIFPSKNDGTILLDYTKKALDVVKNSMAYYIKNYTKLNKSYNYLLENYKEKYPNFDKYNYSGSIKEYENNRKFVSMNNFNIKQLLVTWKTEVETEVVYETTFMLIFNNVKLIKENKIINGLVEGDHHYFRGSVIKPMEEIDVNYDPLNDFIEIKNYKRNIPSYDYDYD